MPLTAAQMSDIFTQGTQMAIPASTVVQLRTEEINNVDNLAKFDETSLKQVAENLRCPPGLDAAGNLMRPFTFSAKSKNRLLATCCLVKLYQDIS